MCGFTLITYTECGHQSLSTSPENTRLCEAAELVGLVQGIDCAPAICNLSNDTETLLVANNPIFDYCDDCRAQARATQETERGKLEDVLQPHAHAQEDDLGFYDAVEIKQTKVLRTLVQNQVYHGLSLSETLEAFIAEMPHALAYITNFHLRTLLSRNGAEKYDELFLNAFREASELVLVLEKYIRQRVPNTLFVETFGFARDNAQKATNLLLNFEIVLDCLLHYEPSRPKEHFNDSEARLDYFSRVLWHISTNDGPDIPPPGFYLYEPDFKTPPAKQLKIETVSGWLVRLGHLCGPERLNLSPQKQAGTLNIHKLHFDPAELVGLLFEEPAIYIQAIHVDIPDGENAMRVDVEDEHGNRLFWYETGKSHVIFAFMRNAVRHYLKKPIQQRKKLLLPATGNKNEE
jgi:hypothetical protein